MDWQLARVKEDTAAPTVNGIHRHVAQTNVADLDRAVDAVFRRVMANRHQRGIRAAPGAIAGPALAAPRTGTGVRRMVGDCAGRGSVRPPCAGIARRMERLLTARIVRIAETWDTRVARATAPSPLPPTGRAVGSDGGIARLIATSDGENSSRPAWHRVAQRRLRALQRRVARSPTVGSPTGGAPPDGAPRPDRA